MNCFSELTRSGQWYQFYSTLIDNAGPLATKISRGCFETLEEAAQVYQLNNALNEALQYAAGSSSLDVDVAVFLEKTGPIAGAGLINEFAKGIKELGIWGQVVFWPMRLSQNAQSGTQVYSLGGLDINDGTLTGGATRSTNGVVIDPTIVGQRIQLTNNFAVSFNPQTTLMHVFFNNGNDATADFAGSDNLEAYLSMSRLEYFVGVNSLANKINTTYPDLNVGSNFVSSTMRFVNETTLFRGVNGGVPTSLTMPAAPTIESRLFNEIKARRTNPSTIAFSMVSQGPFDTVAVYNLYKQTLGQGLFLP